MAINQLSKLTPICPARNKVESRGKNIPKTQKKRRRRNALACISSSSTALSSKTLKKKSKICKDGYLKRSLKGKNCRISSLSSPMAVSSMIPAISALFAFSFLHLLFSELLRFLQAQKINHVRLYDADPDLLRAFAKTKIRVIISVPNNQLLAIGSSNSTAASWIDRNVVAYYPETLITAIAVGDEVLTTVPSSATLLLPAIESLYSALVAANLHNLIKISTPHSFSIMLNTFPPSQASFNQSWNSVMVPLLQFLSRTGSPLMMNLYPYYVFMQNKGVVPLDNCLFKPLTPSKEMVDPNTLLHYTNVLDAMIDAAYVSMRNLNVTDVVVLVSESGWPSKGDAKEPYATIDNADMYNSHLIKHIFDRTGTPLHPEMTSSVYIYELFNEDLRAPPLSEANWGLFYGNSTPAYLLHVSGSGTFLANDTTNQTYCTAMDGPDKKALQAALDWACGPGRANCSEIQPGESCYQPNNVKSHASYAFDSYYQKEGKDPGSCDFKGVAMITTTDPSHGSCIFPGSKKVGNETRTEVNSRQAPTGGVPANLSGGCFSLMALLTLYVFFCLPLC
ncbi:PREDICTED: glucan endo-1,3-beta-glucosidase 1 isoform X2 [Tarenaya hassleriana]|uniref:glucan endo-1,3-beta-glucosidase 1 isoform X2 n=1 Tax=Tarenaya hassleriana TaxID=28532 RepID=UPI00053C12F6|nr:PREDICTED: glucan endo-1,3-beta-glucosidase 1 isoform X2 [Tarenaya hassleriana]